MPTPGTAKYMSLRQQSEYNGHPVYSGPNSVHSRLPSDDYRHINPISPYQPQQYPSTSPTMTATYPSPYNTEPPLPSYGHQDSHAVYNNQYANTYDPQSHDPNIYPPSAVLQHEYPYPTPASPTHPQEFVPMNQYQQQQPQPQQHQVYYPPPPEPSTQSHSHRSQNSYSDHMNSPTGTQFSGTDRHTRSPPSTTQTPAQFYAQPVPLRGPGVLGGGGYGDEGGSPNDSGSIRSLDSRKRPIRGRFVEVDDL